MRLDAAPANARRISPATYGALTALVLFLGALSLFIIGCQLVFPIDDYEACEPGQVSDGETCVDRTPNYYTCECSCTTASPGGFAIGARVRVTFTPDVNVRDNPAGNILGQQTTGLEGTIVAGPVQADLDGDGVPETWWQVDFDTDPDGWVIEPSLEVIQSLVKDLKVCLPPLLNANVDGGHVPSPEEVIADCSTDRVAAHFAEITGQQLPPDTTCSCTATEVPTQWDSSCDAPCGDPSGVCLVASSDPPQPTPEPLSTALFRPTSLCEVSGTADVQVGDELEHTSVQGVIQIHGRQCAPAENCQVGLSYQLILGDISIPVRFHRDPKFVDLSVSGATDAQAIQLAPFLPLFPTLYVGDVATGATLNSARVRREGSPKTLVLVGRNGGPLRFGVDWVNKVCVLDGNFVSTEDGGVVDDDGKPQRLTLRLSLGGPTSRLVNQPPHADAGPDKTVECTSPQGASVSLTGARSTDADGNLAFYVWRRGSETGPQLAAPSANPAVTTQQAGGETTYSLRVVDSMLAADNASVKVTVADTVAPSIECHVPSPTITPPDEPIAFKATATDTCDLAPAVAIERFECFEVKSNGTRVDKGSSCKVVINGDTLTINNSGGVGTTIRWQARATDAAGNVRRKTCEVLVANPGKAN
jgi:hypothetical protein